MNLPDGFSYDEALARIREPERELVTANEAREKAEADAIHVRQLNENYRKENVLSIARAEAAERRAEKTENALASAKNEILMEINLRALEMAKVEELQQLLNRRA